MEASNEFEAGRLHYFVKEWRKVSNDPFVLDIVQHCHLDINVHVIEHLYLQEIEYVFNTEQQQIISEEIGKLLRLKVIQATRRKDDQINSPIFLRKKKNG